MWIISRKDLTEETRMWFDVHDISHAACCSVGVKFRCCAIHLLSIPNPHWIKAENVSTSTFNTVTVVLSRHAARGLYLPDYSRNTRYLFVSEGELCLSVLQRSVVHPLADQAVLGWARCFRLVLIRPLWLRLLTKIIRSWGWLVSADTDTDNGAQLWVES